MLAFFGLLLAVQWVSGQVMTIDEKVKFDFPKKHT